VIDKPAGPTSHDVVARLRRVLGTRRVGHGGTLDPLATGVLVVLVGEATKLSQALTTQEKEYVAKVCFGVGTDTLDADGKIVARRELPEGGLPRAALEAVLAQERARTLQLPPAVSALKVDGRRAYDLARSGQEVNLAPRSVAVAALELRAFDGREATLQLTVSKGYYVRALARDLGQHLGFPAHLSALRRVRSGGFGLDLALPLPTDAAPALLGLAEVARRHLPSAELTSEGRLRALQGKLLEPAHFSVPPPEAEVVAALHGDSLVALLEPAGGGAFQVRRGIHDPLAESPLPTDAPGS
jgi:tRNA pseudouridine55 synthase